MRSSTSAGMAFLLSFAVVGGMVPGRSWGQTAAPATTAPADNVESVRQQLISLEKMRDDRLISEQEFEAARAKLLASIGAVPPVPAAPPAPPPPAAVAPPAPPPPPPPAPAVSLLPTFAGRWAVTRTRIDVFAGQTIQTAERAFNWVVAVKDGKVSISREEEVIHFGHHPEIVVTPVDISPLQLAGKTITFSVKTTEAGHDRLTDMTWTYQLQLGDVSKIGGTYSLDIVRHEPHGVVTSHEAGNVELLRLPG